MALSTEMLTDLIEQYAEMDDVSVSKGRVSGTVYSMNEDIRTVVLKAYETFMYTNPLHPDVFKSIRKMEAEVVAMTLAMFNGDNCVGCMTSGGTESILLACKAYRDQARQQRGIIFPEIVAPVTVHAAFEKAADYFGIRLVHVPVDEVTGKVNLLKMRQMISNNTVALVGSAPNFSLGTMDDIEGIASMALEFGIGSHVDCCLGSFLLPQLYKIGRSTVSAFDFTVKGVTSISCDTHKYGFAPKGSSVLMYRSKVLRRYQYFVSTEWTGGIYATPTLLGSRPGAVVAATWAAMLVTGIEGYRQAAIQISKHVDAIIEGIKQIPELFVYGEPASSVVAFGSKSVNIYAVNDKMSGLGWHLNALQNPPAVHLACTMLTSEETVNDFIKDLMDAVKDAKLNPTSNGDSAAIYGTTTLIPDKSIVEEVAKGYVDLLYKC